MVSGDEIGIGAVVDVAAKGDGKRTSVSVTIMKMATAMETMVATV